MVFTVQALVFLTVAGWVLSDHFHDGFICDHKNIFDPPPRDPCPPHRKCIALNDCQNLREFVEIGDNDDLASIIKDFGCGYHRVLHVCCRPEYDKSYSDFPDLHEIPLPPLPDLLPFFGTEKESSFARPDRISGNRPQKKGTDGGAKPTDGTVSVKPVYENSEDHKGVEGKKPVQVNVEKEDGKMNFTGPLWIYDQFDIPQMNSSRRPTQAETSNPSNNDTDSTTTSIPEWRGPPATFPGSVSQGSFGQEFQGRKPNQGIFSADGWIEDSYSNSQTSYQGFDESLRPSNQGLSSNRPTSSSNYERPSNFGTESSYVQGISGGSRPVTQGFSSGRPSESGLGSQGPQQFGSSFNERPSQGGFERPVGQGFGSSRPGALGFGNERPDSTGFERPVGQGFGSSRPGALGFGNERPDSTGFERPVGQSFGSSRPGALGFGNERPDSTGFERPVGQSFGSSRPGVQGFGNERPDSTGFERPVGQSFGSSRPGVQGFGNERPGSTGFNRPDNYDIDYSPSNINIERPSSGRPGSKRPTSQGSYSGQDSYGSGSFTTGGTNNHRPGNQRPNNEGSKKRPGGSGPNRKKPNRRLLPDGNCGTEISDKIIGGEETSLDEFPWMVLLHFSSRNGQDRGYGCGGSLINERYVLTAAHCIKGPSLPDNTIVDTVRLGEYDITKEKDCMNGVCSPSPIDAAVEEVIVHPEYKPNNKGQLHDIALIRLRKKVAFSSYVSPICIPGDELKSKDYSGKQLVVAGWGKTANGAKGKSSSTKQKVSLPFVTLENCKPFYDGINIKLRNTQMCAGGEKDKDSCQGDSGGPLMSNEMVNGQSSWFVTGIVSFGPQDCGVKNIAGVYTKVSDYVDWILENMKD